MKKILFINQSPNRMLNDIGKVYRSQGWHTSLLCGSLPPATDGFSIIHEATAYNRSSVFKRVSSWLSFTRDVREFVKINKDQFSRIFLVSNPPFLFSLTGLLKSLNNNADIDLLVYDLYPDIIETYAGKIVKPLLFPWRFRNKMNFLPATQIFTPSDSLSVSVRKYYAGRVTTIYNWVDLSEIVPVARENNKFLRQINAPKGLIVLYSGNLGSTHDIATIQGVVPRLLNSNIHFLFAGHGEGMVQLKKTFSDNPLFSFHGWQPEDLFAHSIAAGDVALVSYLPGAEGYSIPSKLPYYFATGTPVIMIGNPNSELAGIIRDNELGWCIQNGDSKSLADLLIILNQDVLSPFRERVIQFVKKNWSLTNAQKFFHE